MSMKTPINNDLRNSFKILLNIALLIAISFVAFYPSFDNQFVNWDDQFYITANPLINNPSWKTLQKLFMKVVSLNYHPLTMLSLWVNAMVSGVESASPFIITNVFIHIFNAIMVWFLVYQLTKKNLVTSLITATVFAIHPMHVESVVWVSERKDVLYGFFFLASLLTYCRYIKIKKHIYLLICFLLFLMSCLSKAMAVSLVPCLLVLDYYKSRDFKNINLYLEKIPFLILALIIGFIAVDVQSGGNFHGLLNLSESANAIQASALNLSDRLLNSSFANFYYIKNFFFPTGHSPFHPYYLKDAYDPLLYISVSILFCSIFLWAIKNNWKKIVLGMAFYFSTIGLVLQFIPVGSAIVAERYSYLPFIGLAFLVGSLLQKFWNLGFKYLVYLIIPILFYALIVNTRMQSDVWQNHVSLFKQAVEVYPNDPFSRKTLGAGLWDQGDVDEAIYHTEYAINELGLVSSSAFELLAKCYSEKGMTQNAIAFFNEAVRLDSNNIIARYHRGLELLKLNVQKAITDFNYCEASNNEYVKPLLYSPRGRAFGMLGKYEMALNDLNKAIEFFPNDINNYLDKAITLEKLNRFENAIELYQWILSINKNESLAIERLKILKTSKM